MGELVRVCAIALVGVITASLLRKSVPEMAVVMTLVLIVGMVAAASGILGSVVKFIHEIAGGAGIDRELMTPVLRCVGISIVSRIGCDVCRDAGVSSAASYIELVSGAASVMCAAPLMLAVLRQIGM